MLELQNEWKRYKQISKEEELQNREKSRRRNENPYSNFPILVILEVIVRF